jgi:hypothetical protein
VVYEHSGRGLHDSQYGRYASVIGALKRERQQRLVAYSLRLVDVSCQGAVVAQGEEVMEVHKCCRHYSSGCCAIGFG